MAKVDLHCHSVYSEHPSEWFLQRIGTKESYTNPELVYKKQKEAGMDFVTITDHNRIDGALILANKYSDAFVGLEATSYFPEDRCKVHVLCWGINQQQFDQIQQLRSNVYNLRDYLVEQNIVHALAHATYSVNGRLTVEHLEKLLLLFNVFEGVNGGRDYLNNYTWMQVLANLSKDYLTTLQQKYNIQPVGNAPWVKGVTGGSDDHSALFLGRAWTSAPGKNPEEFLQAVKNGYSMGQGQHQDFRGLAFAIYKIALDYWQTINPNFDKSVSGQLAASLFENRPVGWKQRLKMTLFRESRHKPDHQLLNSFAELGRLLRDNQSLDQDQRLELAYQKITQITDSFVSVTVGSFSKSLYKGNLGKVLRNISSMLPGVFLSLPFFTTLRHMHSNRQLLDDISAKVGLDKKEKPLRTLWFSDTLTDLNGVAITLNKVYDTARQHNLPVCLASCQPAFTPSQHFMQLDTVLGFKLPFYEKQLIAVPSLLKAIRQIYAWGPDRIIVSTPGPVGLTGMLAARLLNIPCAGVYHTDFTAQLSRIDPETQMVNLVDTYINWFYGRCQHVMVPTAAYIKILASRGLDETNMGIFPRGLDRDHFKPDANARTALTAKHKLKDGPLLLYTGRVSADKSLGLLIQAFKQAALKDSTLIIAGDGPDYNELKNQAETNIIFTGRLEHTSLPMYYAGADLFVFPSTIDTFGMSVLEAQACGLPVLCSAIGGPAEVIKNEDSGFVAPDQQPLTWAAAIRGFFANYKPGSAAYKRLQTSARQNALRFSGWEEFLKTFTGFTAKDDNISKAVPKT